MKMNKTLRFVLIIGLVVVAAVAIKEISGKKQADKTKNAAAADIEYWTCAMHPSVRANEPGNCPICNMPLIPVYKASEETGKMQQSTAGESEAYYGCGVKEEGHCPHCDEGKEDAQCICGGHSFMIKMDKPMDCPICKKPLKKIEQVGAGVVVSRVSLKKQELELAGVKTEALSRHHLLQEIRTVGKVAFDPELAVAQEEFLTAVETREKVKDSPDTDVIKRADDLVEKSKFKLRLLGMDDEEISDLEEKGESQLNLVLPDDKAWIYAEVYEYELAGVKIGQEASVTVTAYPGEVFEGMIKSISPVINPMTRSAKVRIEVENKDQKLKPQMYGDVVISSMYMGPDGGHEVLALPKDAILDTGMRKIVYVDAGGGTFFGKEVVVGPKAVAYIDGGRQEFYPLISGLNEKDMVVTKANFLIDSQSQISGTAGAAYGGALGTEEAKPQPPQHVH